MTYDITFTVEDATDYRRIEATLELDDTIRDILSDELAYEFSDITQLITDTEVSFNSHNNRYQVQWILEPVYKELDEILDDAIFTSYDEKWEVADDPQIQIISTKDDYLGNVSVRCTLMARPVS